MTFPVLRTGAIAQYPLRREVRYRSEVHRFVDGNEQRYRDYPSALREWTIELRSLDERELEAVADFVREMRGMSETFVFVDPVSGAEYAECSLASDDSECLFEGELRGRTHLRVKQNRI